MYSLKIGNVKLRREIISSYKTGISSSECKACGHAIRVKNKRSYPGSKTNKIPKTCEGSSNKKHSWLTLTSYKWHNGLVYEVQETSCRCCHKVRKITGELVKIKINPDGRLVAGSTVLWWPKGFKA